MTRANRCGSASRASPIPDRSSTSWVFVQGVQVGLTPACRPPPHRGGGQRQGRVVSAGRAVTPLARRSGEASWLRLRTAVCLQQPDPGRLQPVHHYGDEPAGELVTEGRIGGKQSANGTAIQLKRLRRLHSGRPELPLVRREQPRPANHVTSANGFDDDRAVPGHVQVEGYLASQASRRLATWPKGRKGKQAARTAQLVTWLCFSARRHAADRKRQPRL